MKRYFPSICLAIFILIISCNKETYFNLGFDSPILKDSHGSLNAEILGTDEKIILNGIIRLSEGELDIILTNSEGVVVFSNKTIAPAEFQINEIFEPLDGIWKLTYTSRGGIGKIDLRIHNY